jgi:hypothetical protein
MRERRERDHLRRLEAADLSPEEIRGFLGDPGARRLHVVRRALAAHPRTPRTDALALIPTLYWKDLAWISSDARAHPEVRRAADAELLRRLPGLAMAEKVEVARSGGRGMIATLRRSGEPPVVRALMRNRFTVEGDVVYMGLSARDPESLEAIAGDPSWSCRAAVRAAVARNRWAPLALSTRLLPGIPLADLREICVERWRPARLLEAARATLAYRTEMGSGATLPA